MGKRFWETLNKRMEDPAFKAEWDELEPERQIMRVVFEKCENQGLTRSPDATDFDQ